MKYRNEIYIFGKRIKNSADHVIFNLKLEFFLDRNFFLSSHVSAVVVVAVCFGGTHSFVVPTTCIFTLSLSVSPANNGNEWDCLFLFSFSITITTIAFEFSSSHAKDVLLLAH